MEFRSLSMSPLGLPDRLINIAIGRPTEMQSTEGKYFPGKQSCSCSSTGISAFFLRLVKAYGFACSHFGVFYVDGWIG